MSAAARSVHWASVNSRAGVGGVLLLAGPAAYVAAQAVYFARAIGRDWQPRVVGVLVLLGAAAAAYWVPPLVAVGLLVVVLGALAWRLGH